MHTPEDDTASQRVAAWFQATPFELLGLAVLLAGALTASLALWWQATSRPSELPSVMLEQGAASADPDVDDADTDAAPAEGEIAPSAGAGDPGGGGPAAGGDPGGASAHTDGAGGAGGAAGADAPGAAGDASAPWLVHVTGAVERPGLVEVPAEARVGDAVHAAGGLASDADPELINLARPLADGEHVRVPRVGDEPVPDPGPGSDPGAAGPSGGAEPGPAADGVIDLNLASAEQLQTLPGIGPARADAIVRHREAHGPFAVPGDLRAVSGIGEATFQRLADLVTVG